ncbi:MAG: PrsW family intramembrane metalloprotease [Cyanobacteria bacterium SZAS LIN-5]|nr:PrsW family intramembrane metalloprotease [Cyanobacteria bacterium SZAS LIN-5]RTL44559.1 MAG: PrsW family intramembrane metalloprotease [Candidatus Melainabacteria bacterium]
MQLILLALAPSLLWLWWFWSTGGRRQPLDALARAFVYGAIAVIPAFKLEGFGGTYMTHNFMLVNFLVIGPVEELFKFIATLIAVKTSTPVRETSNRIVVAAAAALGFAFAENIGFFVRMDPSTIILRMLATVPAHVLLSVPWAVAFGRTRRFTPGACALIVVGLMLSSFLHGAYDALTYSLGSSPFLLLILLALLSAVLLLLYRQYMTETGAPTFHIHLSDFKKPLQWDWVGFIFMLGLTVSLALALLALVDVPGRHGEYSNYTLGAGIIIGLFFTGFLAPFCAPKANVSMREAAVGLSLLGVFVGFLLGKESPVFLKWSFGLAVIGALGGWLGEMLRPSSPVDRPTNKAVEDQANES